jgi:hypothetical protein
MSCTRLREEAVATSHLVAFLDQRVDFEAGVDERQPLDLREQGGSILSLAVHLVAEVAGNDTIKELQISRLPRPQVVQHGPLPRGASLDQRPTFASTTPGEYALLRPPQAGSGTAAILAVNRGARSPHAQRP